MGKLSERAGLYNSNSPVDFYEEPESIETQSTSASLIGDLMDIREKLNTVHSEGYFENHYKEADKGLKEVLHSKAVNTIRQLATPKPRLTEVADKHEGAGRSITINIVLPE